MSQKPRADGARAPDVHDSERAEPSIIDPGTHLDAISLFAPWAGSTEAALRQRIHRARDMACAAATRSNHARARALYWVAADIASERVFARLPDEDLWAAIHSLTRLFLVAGWIEAVEAPDER
jgi:hypothetical protein